MPELSGTTYSEVDASNNQAAPNGMPEGMPPSGVDDAWRAGMGAVKRSYDRDHAGSWCTVGGTANAITLTYAVAPASYVQGEKYAFKATAANTGATTVNVNALGAKSIFKKTPTGVAACTGGEIQNGDLVELEYDGTQFQFTGQTATAGVFTGGTLTGTTGMSGAAFNEAQVAMASAATLAIGAAAGNYIAVTGTTAITAFDTVQAGTERTLEFAAALTLTHNATSLILPGAANITTAAGDVAKFRSEGAGNWRCVGYMPAAGVALGLASAATTLAGTNATQALTAAGFAGNKSLAANGYYKLPGGLIVQWGTTGSIAGSGTATFTFPIAFPTAVWAVVVTGFTGTNIVGMNLDGTPTTIAATVRNTSSNAQNSYVIAIGN
jgi:hypothetical protein